MKRLFGLLVAIALSTGLYAQTKPAPQNKYRLIISFLSIGSGIDGQSKARITEYISKHPKKPVFEEFKWGREGEVDYCLHLKELSPAKQKAFVKAVKKLINRQDLVLVTENQEYVKKGR